MLYKYSNAIVKAIHQGTKVDGEKIETNDKISLHQKLVMLRVLNVHLNCSFQVQIVLQFAPLDNGQKFSTKYFVAKR